MQNYFGINSTSQTKHIFTLAILISEAPTSGLANNHDHHKNRPNRQEVKQKWRRRKSQCSPQMILGRDAEPLGKL